MQSYGIYKLSSNFNLFNDHLTLITTGSWLLNEEFLSSEVFKQQMRLQSYIKSKTNISQEGSCIYGVIPFVYFILI